MDSLLIIVSVTSVALAIASGGVVARLLADERRRSALRVALLAEMAAEAIAERADAPADIWEPRSANPVVTAPELFSTPEHRSAWPKRLAVVASIAALVVFAGLAARAIGALDRTPTVRAANAPATAGSSQMLDLLSLEHAQQPDVLTITGLVQNPNGGASLSNIAATAFLFGADGTFLASGRAPLDFAILRPGAETGFVINVPVNVPVARYRVGFRGEDGRIIGHVDRRLSGTIARGPS
jgi:hypothetical protein